MIEQYLLECMHAFQLLCFTGTASRDKLLASFVNGRVIIHSLSQLWPLPYD